MARNKPINFYPFEETPAAVRERKESLQATAVSVKWCPFLNSTCKQGLCALWGDGECTQRRK